MRGGDNCSKDLSRVRAERYARAASRWARLLLRRRKPDGVRVFYGHDRVPGPGDPVAGGSGKFQRLAQRFPNSPTDFSLLYLGSTWLPRDTGPLLSLARRRDVPVVLNQSGVAYPGWAGDETERINNEFRRPLLAADHVLYQSEFCKRSADDFLGSPRGTWEVLPNAVDVEEFRPGDPPNASVLLLAGDQSQAYRLEVALRTLAQLPEARLIVTGRVVSDPQPLLRELEVADRVELVGRYAQRDAPELYRRADLLLHTKVQDPCPTAVLEAMACGLPVVYASSGGTVELVGDEAGVGVPHPVSWERDEPPTPEAFAEAVRTALAQRDRLAAAARRRAVERFALGPWLDRHAELFSELAAPRARTSRAR
jgi:glycosyltransferase involved in cell wall biosynthesis